MAEQQLGVLKALDVAKTQLYHFTAIVIAGMGFFTDAYDLFCVSLVTKLLGRLYYFNPLSEKPGSLPPHVAAAVNGVALCGTLAGQLFFGWLGDKLGRKKVYGITLIMMIVCSVASGLSFGNKAKGVMTTLCFFRFWLGFGIGGDYPLSATIMSEYANKKTRGAFIAAVFAMQGVGILAGGFAKMAEQQLGVLKALDVAKTQLYHFTAIVIAGMGFFTDAYDLFCVSLVTKLLGRLYYFNPLSEKPGSLPPHVAAAVNGVALCGTLAGQLFFGWLGDKLGRKKVYGITLIMMIVCSVASGLSFGNKAKGVMTTLCFFRFWLGFGIGGDYPLSATIMSEYANKKTRGAFIAAVFAMQGVGILAGGFVALAVSSIFDKKFPAPTYAVNRALSTPPQADYIWRIIVMFGALPAALTYYWRMKMPETARYTALVAKNIKQATQDMSKVLQVELEMEERAEDIVKDPRLNYGLFSKEFAKRHGLPLLGCTSTWFLLDIAFYSQNLFQKDIFSAIGWIPKAATMNAIHEVFMIARAQTLIALCSTVPGYWFTVAFIDIMGRFAIQLMGFFMMTVFMFAIAFPYDHWIKPDNRIGFVVMYSLTFFFANFGPNATTFIVPAEIFPARLRSTCHGISAATGKAGAIVGAFGFLYAAQSQDKTKTDAGYPPGIGVKNSLIMLGVINFVGMLFTFLVPEPKGKSLEELSGETEAEK
ncbi:unnamed protein product [Brassica oleracea var. botrytis]